MKRSWWIMTGLAVIIAAYAFLVVGLREQIYPPDLVDSFRARPWGIIPHAALGGVAMLIGPFQFHRGWLARRRPLHRTLGKVYVFACLGTGLAGLYMAWFAFGGAVARLGFGLLAVATLITTLVAYRAIRRRTFVAHREWMIRSYALIYAAVMLRLLLPVLVPTFGAFAPAYRLIAWLCWVPNLVFAEWLVRSGRRRGVDRGVLELARSSAA